MTRSPFVHDFMVILCLETCDKPVGFRLRASGYGLRANHRVPEPGVWSLESGACSSLVPDDYQRGSRRPPPPPPPPRLPPYPPPPPPRNSGLGRASLTVSARPPINEA